jgi:hypothetical protein
MGVLASKKGIIYSSNLCLPAFIGKFSHEINQPRGEKHYLARYQKNLSCPNTALRKGFELCNYVPAQIIFGPILSDHILLLATICGKASASS